MFDFSHKQFFFNFDHEYLKNVYTYSSEKFFTLQKRNFEV